MDNQSTIWIKQEERDDVHIEPASVVPEDPLRTEEPSLHVKHDPELILPEDKSCRTAAMDNREIVWIKQEETDDVSNEPGSMFVDNPLGICCSTDFIKEDPEDNLGDDETENIVAASVTHASRSTGLIQNGGEVCGISFQETQGCVHNEQEMGAWESAHCTMFGAHTQELTAAASEEEEEEEEEEEDEDESLFGTRLKCILKGKKIHKFSCSFCLQSFSSKYRLIKHVFIHLDGVQPPTYVCKSCGEVFPSIVYLNKHLKMNEGNQVSCPANNEKNDYSDDHENIFLEADPEVSFVQQTEKLSSCQKTWKISRKSFYDVHKTHTVVCNAEKQDGHDDYESSSIAADANDHTALLTGKRPHKCDACGKSFTRLSHLKDHSLRHSGMRPYKCDVCAKSFTELGNLKRHSLIHIGMKPHKCDTCAKSFSDLGNLKRHSLIHTGMKPHKCDICSKSFSDVSSLKRHSLIHSGMGAHTCATCSKSFTRVDNLKTHVLIHTGMKPHRCGVCGKSFSQLGNLQRHVVMHTGKKPHKCDT